ncbi:MAG: hypothetical protein M0R77_07480 [Gammaproteobacteria bacterium]|nr:hypothetical protein [Gammaproteobacteria bacterium]
MDSNVSANSVNSRINKFVEKFAVWIIGALFSLGVAGWNKMDSDIDRLEERVAFLYQDKVSRQELKDEMFLLRTQIERDNQDMRRGQEQLRGDILSRLELILKLGTPQKIVQ